MQKQIKPGYYYTGGDLVIMYKNNYASHIKTHIENFSYTDSLIVWALDVVENYELVGFYLGTKRIRRDTIHIFKAQFTKEVFGIADNRILDYLLEDSHSKDIKGVLTKVTIMPINTAVEEYKIKLEIDKDKKIDLHYWEDVSYRSLLADYKISWPIYMGPL